MLNVAASFYLNMYLLAVDPIAVAQAAFDAGHLAEARVHLESAPNDARAAALLARVYTQLKLPQLAADAPLRAALLY